MVEEINYEITEYVTQDEKVKATELAQLVGITAVSYTHLTLPTNREV